MSSTICHETSLWNKIEMKFCIPKDLNDSIQKEEYKAMFFFTIGISAIHVVIYLNEGISIEQFLKIQILIIGFLFLLNRKKIGALKILFHVIATIMPVYWGESQSKLLIIPILLTNLPCYCMILTRSKRLSFASFFVNSFINSKIIVPKILDIFYYFYINSYNSLYDTSNILYIYWRMTISKIALFIL